MRKILCIVLAFVICSFSISTCVQAENETTDTYAYFLTANGKVQIKEKDANTELLSDSMVKKSVYTYTADAEGMFTTNTKYSSYEENLTNKNA